MPKVRLPTQAGTFYEGKPRQLRQQIEECFLSRLGPGDLPKIANHGLSKIVGLVCPHAGYMFSGPVAAHAYAQLSSDGRPDTVILLGPNHQGVGSGIAIMNEGIWRTPLGDLEIDLEVADRISSKSGIIDVDSYAHSMEHSIEVQLPFLQYLYGSDFKIVPICFLMQDLATAKEIGEAVAEAVVNLNAVVIASSDMSHYVPEQVARTNDLLAIREIENMDENRFLEVVESKGITACGYGPIAALMMTAKKTGVGRAKLLCYKTSGDTTGDRSSVVGYAAISFMK